MFKPCNVSAAEQQALEVARVGLMSACPFYAHLFYNPDIAIEVLTQDVPTAATDGKHLFINPTYVAGLKPSERVFVYAHEMSHLVNRQPQRMVYYDKTGLIRATPYVDEQFQHAMDYVINADLLEQGVGSMNPEWLYAPDVTGEMLAEDVYERKYKEPPEGGGGGGGGEGGTGGTTYAQSGKAPRGAQRDPHAKAQGGAFDQLLPPETNPVTGKEDLPSEATFKEAVARAADAAKAMGKLPASLERKVKEILDPQLDWKDHIRMLVTGRIGARHETWDKPNRRRLVLNPMVIMPGRRGYGADCVVIGVDTSGSIGERELSAFFAEVGGVLADVKPRRVVMIACDAKVQQVDEATTVEELAEVRTKGLKGGGGTSFRPVFEYVEEHNLRPETMIYITDLLGTFPSEKPAYPVVWCATTDEKVPFGDVVRIKVA